MQSSIRRATPLQHDLSMALEHCGDDKFPQWAEFKAEKWSNGRLYTDS